MALGAGAAALAGRLAPRPVRLVDERFTTVLAHDALRRGGRDARDRRGAVDKAAAALLLQGALEAESKVGLKMNAPKKALKAITAAVPSLRDPTVSPLSNPDWVALETIIDESVVREILPQLKALGAEGIVEYPLNKVVY